MFSLLVNTWSQGAIPPGFTSFLQGWVNFSASEVHHLMNADGTKNFFPILYGAWPVHDLHFRMALCGHQIPAKNIIWSIECHHHYSNINNMMGKTKKFSIDLRWRIINFHKSGNSYSTISNWLAIPRSMVKSFIKRFKQFGTTENLPGCERKPKLSPRNAGKCVTRLI